MAGERDPDGAAHKPSVGLRSPQDIAACHSKFDRMPIPTGTTWYRLGDGHLGVRADDAEFSNRFDELYRECATRGAAPEGTPVAYSVRSIDSPSCSLVQVDGGRLDLMEFALHLFGGRGYREVAVGTTGWRGLAPSDGSGTLFAFGADEILVDRRAPWQRFVANLAVNQVLGQQPDLLCYHAAALGVNGAGMLLTGPKGAGKTTLALALAARGHDFLGDEVAAVRVATRVLLPFRRSVSVRPGPTATAVQRTLAQAHLQTEAFPDGSTRLRGRVGELFPESGVRPVPLRSVVVLRGFGDTTRLVRFVPGRDQWAIFSPLGCSLWRARPAERVMRVLTLFSQVRCYFLEVRSADEAADVLERLPED